MESEQTVIAENILSVRNKIASAAERSSRKAGDIKLVAVTKTVGADLVSQAVAEGLLDLGENRVQELCGKYEVIDKSVRWHLIGHLQTNKVKYIIDKVSMIHSVDSLELAKEIDLRAGRAGRMTDVLIEVNVAGEDTKFGLSSNEVRDFIIELHKFGNIKIKGLMTVAPYAQNPEEVRPVFRQLHKIFIDMRKENTDNINMEFLSMGMSNDFEIAIEEGANIVRIGTAIFGRRHY